jgi:Outer membrane protein beta-barrel domain
MSILSKVFIILFTIPFPLFAQDIAVDKEIKFGIKLGANFANLNTKNTISNSNIVGVNSGILLQIPISKKINIQPEVCFMGNGAVLTFNNSEIIGAVKYGLSYLQVPVLIDYTLHKFIHLHAGPYVSYLLASDIKNNESNNLFNFETNIQNPDFNTFDVGLIGGASLHVQNISLGVRYNLGLLAVANNKTILSKQYDFANGSNRVASIYLCLVP